MSVALFKVAGLVGKIVFAASGSFAAAHAAFIFTAAVLPVVAGLLATNAIAKAFAPKPPKTNLDRSFTLQYSDTVSYGRMIYGRVQTSGMNVIPPLTSGAEQKRLHQVLALCIFEVSAITDVYFGQTLIASASIDGSGNITAGVFAGKASIRKRLGTSTQTVDTTLNSAIAAWLTTSRGRGIADLSLWYEITDPVFKGSLPDVSCIVEGALTFDPRTSTTVWSQNPALCLRDVLTRTRDEGGGGVAASLIDDTLCIAAANDCDVSLTAGNAPPSGAQPRYTCNVILDAGMPLEDKIRILARAMLGVCYFNGKWRMYSGKWLASAFTIEEKHILGAVQGQLAADIDNGDRYNYVRGVFVDAARKYQRQEFEPQANATYETEDGGRMIPLDIELPTVTNNFEAQRHGRFISRQSRNDQVMTLRLPLIFEKIMPYECGTVSIPNGVWSDKSARCTRHKTHREGFIEATFIEGQSSDWTALLTAEYTTPGTPAAVTPGTYKPGAPTGFGSTGVQDGIEFVWTPPLNATPGLKYRLYEHTATSPFSSAVQVSPDTPQTRVLLQKADLTERYYWVIAVDPIGGGASSEAPSGNGLPGKAKSLSSGFSVTISGDPTKVGTASSLTTPAATANPINGVAPFTYAWSFHTGGTGITINTSTTQSTSFSATGLADGEERTGMAKCLVTDSTGGTPLTFTAYKLVSTRRETFA